MFQVSQFITEWFSEPYCLSHINTISNVLDKVCTDYENLILLGGFIIETEETYVWIYDYV